MDKTSRAQEEGRMQNVRRCTRSENARTKARLATNEVHVQSMPKFAASQQLRLQKLGDA
jgi:hypothetical protein